jgi:hypothetical protein
MSWDVVIFLLISGAFMACMGYLAGYRDRRRQSRRLMARAWDEAYRAGIEDERTSAVSGTDYGANRNNPYRAAGAGE